MPLARSIGNDAFGVFPARGNRPCLWHGQFAKRLRGLGASCVFFGVYAPFAAKSLGIALVLLMQRRAMRGGLEGSIVSTLFQAASLQAYRARLDHVVPLNRDEERALALRHQAGDRDAGRRIIEACLPFVVSIALEYRRWGVPLEDIVQQGNVGLLRAVAKFDTSKDCRLATYAAYWIRAEIREYVVRGYRVVRLGTTKAERRALRAYRTTRESDPERLAQLSGLSVDRVRGLLPLLQGREASLEGAATTRRRSSTG